MRRKWLAEAARGSAGVIAISKGVRDDLLALGIEAEASREEMLHHLRRAGGQ